MYSKLLFPRTSLIFTKFQNVRQFSNSYLILKPNFLQQNPVKYSKYSLMKQYSDNAESNQQPEQKKVSTFAAKKALLKRAIAEYGSTVVVLHISIALANLGLWYLIVSSGLDIEAWLKWMNVNESTVDKLTAVEGAGTFAIAYIIHKMLFPVRVSLTLGLTPFVVKYLRQKGILKAKVKTVASISNVVPKAVEK